MNNISRLNCSFRLLFSHAQVGKTNVLYSFYCLAFRLFPSLLFVCFIRDRFLPTLLDMSVDGGWGDSDRCVAVAGGWSHSLAVTACGKAFGWGCGADGRIGVGCYSDQLRPSLIYLYNNMFDDRDDEIGEDDGDPGSKRQVDPDEELAYSLKERERPVVSSDDPVRKAVAGYAHSAFLTSSGTLYTSGCGVSGQLARFENIKIDGDGCNSGDGYTTKATRGDGGGKGGQNNDETQSEMIPAVVSLVPRPVQWPVVGNDEILGIETVGEKDSTKNDFVGGGTVIVDVACGDHHTVAISASGELYTWGLDQAGQCGGFGGHSDNEKPVEKLAPTRFRWIRQRYGNDAVVVKIACGPSSTAAIIIE